LFALTLTELSSGYSRISFIHPKVYEPGVFSWIWKIMSEGALLKKVRL